MQNLVVARENLAGSVMQREASALDATSGQVAYSPSPDLGSSTLVGLFDNQRGMTLHSRHVNSRQIRRKSYPDDDEPRLLGATAEMHLYKGAKVMLPALAHETEQQLRHERAQRDHIASELDQLEQERQAAASARPR